MSAAHPSAWGARLVLVFAALILMLPAVWNGQPFFYPDTTTYLRGAEMGIVRLVGGDVFKPWLPPVQAPAIEASAAPASPAPAPAKRLTSIADKVVLAGRSVYYGALLYLGYVTGGFWLSVAIQALCAAYMLNLLMARIWACRRWHVIASVAALGVLTPMAAYTGFLMPDLFAPLVILCTATLALYWGRLPRSDRLAVSAILLFGLCAHASHLVLAALLLGALVAARAIGHRWRSVSAAGLLTIAGCVVGALGAEWAFNRAVTAAVGTAPLRLPHLAGRLIDMGPGTDYLKKYCPQIGFAACAYVQNYPTHWTEFLFSTDPGKGAFALADVATKRRLSDEQLAFFLAVLKHDPAGVVGGMGIDVLRQLGQFRVDFVGYGENGVATHYAGRVPEDVFTAMQNSRAAQRSPYNDWLTSTTYAAVFASLVFLCISAWCTRREATAGLRADPAQQAFACFVLIVIAGVVGNAFVCAVLASSLDRFQARVIWLLPFIALAAHFRFMSHRVPRLTGEADPMRALQPSFNPSHPFHQGTPS